ncbi:MAG: acetate kinase, partial [Burkholderiales bacterium]|nr:acetate kinase [Burkholderiales bacterium]
GQIDEMKTAPTFVVKSQDDKQMYSHEWGEGHLIDHAQALTFVINWLESNVAGLRVVGAGHRIVLGGTRYEAPTLIEGDALDYLDKLSIMEPSHQPYNVAGARAMAKMFRHLPQVGCFDTSFHR